MTTLPVTHPLYGAGTSTSIISQGVRRIHTTFQQGTEMIEEFDADTDRLKARRVRGKSDLGVQGPWKFEVGDAIQSFNPSKDLIGESSNNPIFSRHDSPSAFIFRIRNLPYPPSTYSFTVSPRAITLRTSNRKYYKVITIPEVSDVRGGGEGKGGLGVEVELREERLRWEWGNNTLVVWYEKPTCVREREEREKVARKGLQSVSKAPGEHEAPDCKQQ